MDPVILLAVADPTARDDVAARIGGRFGDDYSVEVVASAPAALDRLHALRDSAVPVAMVLADADVSTTTDDDLLAHVRTVVPTAVRIALFGRGDQRAGAACRRAAALGHIDAGLPRPVAPRDEDFFGAITEYLAEWAWISGTVVDAVTIVGDARSSTVRAMTDVLQRYGVSAGVHDPTSSIGRRLLAQVPPDAALPVVQVLDEPPLVAPTLQELAAQFGFVGDVTSDVYDLTVVGAGPAGLAAAVYGASEGLSTLVVEQEAIGGQAGTSSMIRNYLGFPRGVSGRRLATNAFTQAGRFGAAFHPLRAVTGLDTSGDGMLSVSLSDGATVRSRTVLLACGVAYRRLSVPSVEDLVGAGVFYGAATGEARALQGLPAFVVGAGNSAGQAALHLARYASTVTMIVRGDDPAASMSDYLLREIAAHDRVTVRTRTEVVDGGGTGHLQWLVLRDNRTGDRVRVEAGGLLILIGADPHTAWLPAGLQRDERGYVLTGADIDRRRWSLERPPMVFETSMPGVFAAGDVRAGSVKRVAAAAGEGAVVVPMLHSLLSRRLA